MIVFNFMCGMLMAAACCLDNRNPRHRRIFWTTVCSYLGSGALMLGFEIVQKIFH